jgi:hypothetical protein
MGLISTGDLRTWMGIEEGDKKPNEKLSAIALAIEEFVDSFTNRALEAKTYIDDQDYCYLDGTGRPYIYLPVTPVSYVSNVAIDADRVFGSGTLIASSDLYWYPKSGKLMSEAGYFTRGRRNVKVQYTAGYAPIVGGTHNSAVSTYPIPLDLKQTMIEMCVESFKEGMTAVHSVLGEEPKFIQMLGRNSFWRLTLNKYKDFSAALSGRDE